MLANWELVLVQFVQTVLVSLLMVAGVVPLILAIGVGSIRAIGADFESGGPPAEAVDDLLATLAESTGPLLLATIVALIVWAIAMFVLAYFQAGVFGVLAAADRRAPLPTAPRAEFRVFSLSRLRGAADDHVWRFFWLLNLMMAAASLPLAIFGGAVLLGAWLVATESVSAAVATGCLGLVLVVVLSFVVSLWWQLSMAVVAAGPAGLGAAIGWGLKILLRRLGAVLVLVLLAMVVGMTMAVVFVPLGIVLDVAVRDSFVGYVLTQIVMTVIQSLMSGCLSVAFAAALVALVRGEMTMGELKA